MGEIISTFIIFCAVWIVTQIIWKMIESYMQQKQIEKTMDRVYARFVRLLISFYQDIKEVRNNAKM